MFTIATFYHFFDFAEYERFRRPLKQELLKRDIKGSLLIAAEGVNGTLAGSKEAIRQFLGYLSGSVIKAPLEHKESMSERQPFKRAKVRLKKETISLGEPVTSRETGTYVGPEGWNALIADPNTIVLDTRNKYEVRLGTFKNAVDPKIRTFKRLPDFVRKHLKYAKHKKIATFCTGGIRCEKLAPWLLEQGFKDVYQLKGGILKYLEEMPEQTSAWQGECYVFDERIAVGHGLAPSPTASQCQGCGSPLTPRDRAHPLYRENQSCPYCPS